MKKHARIMVHGKPFFTLGGQTRNSSSYVLPEMRRAWASVKALGGNTVATPVPWDAFEPEEGQFNAAFVTDLIDAARAEGLKLVFLWFATWKNGTMEYCPIWVKKDTKRFQRVLHKDGTVIHQLSAHSRVLLEADKRAFCKLMQVIRDYDQEEQTVIAVQVENEAGILGGTRRDFSPLGEAAFAGSVPGYLVDYCKAHPETLLARRWQKAGAAESGNWVQVFGQYGAEALTAHAIASYIDEIAAAGKEIYDIFLYANVWLDGGSRGNNLNLAGIDWPAGCATIRNVDIYYATCKALDTIAPDNYQMELTRYNEVTRAYAHPENGFPLYVPESHAGNLNATLMFDAIANYGAIGYHIFGTESCVAPDLETLNPHAEPMMHSMRMLTAAMPLLEKYQDTPRIHAMVQYTGEMGQVIEDVDGNWKLAVSFGRSGDGWPATDFRHDKASREEGQGIMDPTVEKARGLIFQVADNEFYLVGHKCRVNFAQQEPLDGSIPLTMAHPGMLPTNANYLSVTEGHFDEQGTYVVDIVRSGDEVRHGIWCQYDVGVIRVLLD